jgi:hypothetical protein
MTSMAGELQHIDPQHPPDKQYCNDCPSDMNDPVASCFRFAEIEHDGIVARTQVRLTLPVYLSLAVTQRKEKLLTAKFAKTAAKSAKRSRATRNMSVDLVNVVD